MSLPRCTSKLAAAAAALAATVALAACGSDDEKTPTTAAQTAPAVPSAGVYGTYHRRVTRADLSRTDGHRSESGPTQEMPLAGTYRLTIARGSAQDVLKATDPQDFVIAMDVTLDRGGLLRATSYVDPNQGAFCGPEIPIPANYAYTSHGGELVLTAKDDPCADRDSILTGTWTRG